MALDSVSVYFLTWQFPLQYFIFIYPNLLILCINICLLIFSCTVVISKTRTHWSNLCKPCFQLHLQLKIDGIPLEKFTGRSTAVHFSISTDTSDAIKFKCSINDCGYIKLIAYNQMAKYIFKDLTQGTP